MNTLNPQESEDIVNVLADFFNLTKEDITGIYQELHSSFRSEQSSSHSGFLSLPKPGIDFRAEVLEGWKNATLIGIDFPLWLNCDSVNNQTIMVVGIDPLRKRKDFYKFPKGNAIIGTPYALHSSFYRESKGRTKVYWDVVKYLFSINYNVYLTDIFKIWMNDHAVNERVKFSLGSEMAKFTFLFKQELEIVKPVAIVAFGNQARDFVTGMVDRDMRILHLPHPSGANKSWNTILPPGGRTVENKVEYLTRMIEEGIQLNDLKPQFF